MHAVQQARQTVLQPLLDPRHLAIGSINSPMQCMMKEVCAQCLQKQKDPVTGKEYVVFSCFNQDQELDRVDFAHLRQRLRANSMQEKLSNAWLDRILAGAHGPAEACVTGARLGEARASGRARVAARSSAMRRAASSSPGVSSGIASSISKGPERVRRSAVRCPSVPSDAARSRAGARTCYPLARRRHVTASHPVTPPASIPPSRTSMARVLTARGSIFSSASPASARRARSARARHAVLLDRGLYDGRHLRRPLLLVLHGSGQEIVQLPRLDPVERREHGKRHVGPLHHGPLGVEGVGLRAERDGRLVRLVRRGEPGRKLRRLSGAHDEHPRGHRVERPGVPDLARPQHAAQPRDDVVARRPARLVDDEDAADVDPFPGDLAASSERRSSVSARWPDRASTGSSPAPARQAAPRGSRRPPPRRRTRRSPASRRRGSSTSSAPERAPAGRATGTSA